MFAGSVWDWKSKIITLQTSQWHFRCCGEAAHTPRSWGILTFEKIFKWNDQLLEVDSPFVRRQADSLDTYCRRSEDGSEGGCWIRWAKYTEMIKKKNTKTIERYTDNCRCEGLFSLAPGVGDLSVSCHVFLLFTFRDVWFVTSSVVTSRVCRASAWLSPTPSHTHTQGAAPRGVYLYRASRAACTASDSRQRHVLNASPRVTEAV